MNVLIFTAGRTECVIIGMHSTAVSVIRIYPYKIVIKPTARVECYSRSESHTTYILEHGRYIFSSLSF